MFLISIFFSFKSYITFSFLLLCFIAVQCSKVLLPSFFLPKFLLPQNVAFSRISYQMLCMLLNPFSIVSFNLLDLLKILLQLELPLRLLRWFWINFRLITASILFFFFPLQIFLGYPCSLYVLGALEINYWDLVLISMLSGHLKFACSLCSSVQLKK